MRCQNSTIVPDVQSYFRDIFRSPVVDACRKFLVVCGNRRVLVFDLLFLFGEQLPQSRPRPRPRPRPLALGIFTLAAAAARAYGKPIEQSTSAKNLLSAING